VSTPTRAFTVWLALLALTGASFGASYLHLGRAGVVVALGIAAVKASLVLLVFMELRDEPVSARVAVGAGLGAVMLLMFFMVADVVTQAPSPFGPSETAPRQPGKA
jgi:cytochrome c oxidase subunit 4